MLKSLTSPAGRKGNDVPLQTTNRKNIRIACDRPVDFWIGARVRKRFSGRWFQGTVVAVTSDEGETLYRVVYDDCDQEDLDKGQLWDSVIFHPRMCEIEAPSQRWPRIHSVVVFAHHQQPRLGKITHVDEEAQRPITIQLWKPHKDRSNLYQARYKPSSMNHEADLIQLQLDQIKLQDLEFDAEGKLKPSDQRRFQRYLAKNDLNAKVTPGEDKGTPGHGRNGKATMRASSIKDSGILVSAAHRSDTKKEESPKGRVTRLRKGSDNHHYGTARYNLRPR